MFFFHTVLRLTVDTVEASVSCSVSVSPEECKKLIFPRYMLGSTVHTR